MVLIPKHASWFGGFDATLKSLQTLVTEVET